MEKNSMVLRNGNRLPCSGISAGPRLDLPDNKCSEPGNLHIFATFKRACELFKEKIENFAHRSSCQLLIFPIFQNMPDNI